MSPIKPIMSKPAVTSQTRVAASRFPSRGKSIDNLRRNYQNNADLSLDETTFASPSTTFDERSTACAPTNADVSARSSDELFRSSSELEGSHEKAVEKTLTTEKKKEPPVGKNTTPVSKAAKTRPRRSTP